MTTLRFTREQIFEGVREDVAECLAVEPDEITFDTNFRLDLGGESIDVLDLAFRSEKRFGIRSPFSRLMSPERWAIDESGKPTEEMTVWLNTGFPTIEWASYIENTSWNDPLNLFTIRLIVDLLFDAQCHPPSDHQIPNSAIASRLA